MKKRAAALLVVGGLFAVAAFYVARSDGSDLPADIQMWGTLAFVALALGCVLLASVKLLDHRSESRS